MQVTRQRDTPCELAIRKAVHRRGLRFRVDWPIPGSRRRADLAFISAKVIVFVDGCFWHGCPTHGTWPKTNAAWWKTKIEANIRRDRDTDATLRAKGWRVLRYWEHHDPERAAQAIVKVARRRSQGR